MDPLTAGALAGGSSLVGTVLSNQASSAEAQKNRDFQERMSNTSHQRQVEDLRKAGLNPILSALGSGASTPGGSQANINDLGAGISKGADTALAVRAQNKEFQLKDANIENVQADTGNKGAQKALLHSQAVNSAEDAKMKTLQSKVIRETLPSVVKKAKAEGDYSELNQIMGVINSGINSAAGFTEMLPILGTALKGLKGSKQLKLPGI